MYDGNIQIFDKNEKKISEIEFETYDLNLTPYAKQENKHIYSDELLTNEIIENLKDKKRSGLINMKKTICRNAFKIHKSFIHILLVFSSSDNVKIFEKTK